MANDIALKRLQSQASYSDLNKNFGKPGAAELVFDREAITQSLYNIFKTHIGEAGPIFLPTFGSGLPELLQEPLDSSTAFSIRSAAIQAVQRWETRVDLDIGNCSVSVDYTLPGYQVILAYTIRQTGERGMSTIPLRTFTAGGETVAPIPSTMPSWIPSNLPQLAAWYDGADGRSVVQSISRVSKWKDKSGKGNTVQATLISASSNAFSIGTGAINGLNAMRMATGTNPNSMSFTNPVTLGADFHAFLVLRNDALGFQNGDSFGINFLTQSSTDPLAAVLRLNLGLNALAKLPYVSSKQPDQPDTLFQGYVTQLEDITVNFIEVKREADHLTVFINREVIATVPFAVPDFVVTNLLSAFGAISADPALYVGETLIFNQPLSVTEVESARGYLETKWSSTAVDQPPRPIDQNVLSDVTITSVLMPQSVPTLQTLKVTIQHTRTSRSQSIQYKLLASGSGVTKAKKIQSGSIIRLSGALPVENNPVISNHAFTPYSQAELVGPFDADGIWKELMTVGLVFTSVADTVGRVEILFSYPTGVDLAYPGVSFGDMTFTVIPIGTGLSSPAATTFHLDPLAPVANFTANDFEGYAPMSVTFSDLSSGPATGWNWSFKNDGNINSTEQNPTYEYPLPGTYSVALTSTNSAGSNTVTKNAFITVHPSINRDDPYLDKVALLLHAEGPNDSVVFLDSSTLQSAVTPVAAAKITTSQYKYGQGGINLATAGASLTADAVYPEFTDFTYEAWVKAPGPFLAANKYPLLGLEGAGSNVWVGINGANGCLAPAVSETMVEGVQIFIPNVWNHVAIVRHNGTVYTWLNGRFSDGLIDSAVGPLIHPLVGKRFGNSFNTLAYYDEVRLTLGVARYLNQFIPPEGPFPDGTPAPVDPYWPNVAFLLHYDAPSGSSVFVDSSLNRKTPVASSNAVITDNPKVFGIGAYNASSPGRYLEVPAAYPAYDDFTLEGWYQQGVHNPAFTYPIFGLIGGSNLWLAFKATGLALGTATSGSAPITAGTQSMVQGQWYHVAMVRKNGVVTAYLNGVPSCTLNDAVIAPLTSVYFNRRFGTNFTTLGYHDETRLTLGVARYDGPFAVPPGPFPETDGVTPVVLDADFASGTHVGPSPLTVQFVDTSAGQPTGWEWSFNNDGIVNSTEKNPSYTFVGNGKRTVKLHVTRGQEDSVETKTDYVSVGVLPVPSFTRTPTSGPGPLTVNFTDTSTG